MRRLGSVIVLLCLLAPASASAFEARGSAEQVYVTKAEPEAAAVLLDGAGKQVRSKPVNDLGAVLFRKVEPGAGYKVRIGAETSEALTVLTNDPTPPSTDVYDQEVPADGYGYMTMRDGTKLAYAVHPPTDVTNAVGVDLPATPPGPVPTLIEYSGYAYARPSGPQSGIAVIANLMGFAVVDVNMRGTGCSGGAYDFFEPLQSLDGYDIIETVARQPWVAHGKVGLFGISYGGISQLFTAQTQPPSLAAITPVSLIDQVQTTLYPGGMLNNGFAFDWAKQRAEEARPAGPEAGQPYAWERIEGGDETCKENQALHGEAIDLLGKVRRNNTYKPKVADPLSPITFVDKINVPTFLACQNTDEQTGGHCPTLASRFTGTDKKWFTFTNGTHVDSLGPETINRLYDFLMLYVAKQPPIVNSARLQAAAPVLYQAAMGIDGVTMRPDPVQQEPTYEGALAKFESFEPVRILFETGAGGDEPGQPYPAFEDSFASYPPPGRTGKAWYFGADGTLLDKPAARGADRFTWDAVRGREELDNLKGGSGADPGGVWTALPDYDWQPDPPGTAVTYTTAELAENTVVVGGGAIHAWVRSSRRNVDLQATITEIRPDGKEVFVQGGWVRGAMRKLDKGKSTRLEPVLSLRKRDMRLLPRKRFAKVTIPLYYQSHPYRKGSRIRVKLSAPNGDQPIWAFNETKPKLGKTAQVRIGYGGKRRSRLLLPTMPGLEVPTDYPPCPGLRGQPCRDAAPDR